MKKLILLLLILFPLTVYGNQIEEWIKQLEHPKWESDELKPQNFKSKYIKYDFSNLLMPRSKFLGYIEPNYKRIKLHFSSIRKIEPDKYNVKGTSIVGKNNCGFEGQIIIKQIRELKRMNLGCDEELRNVGFKAQGLLWGEYEFKENPANKHSGMFKGIMTLYWFLDKKNNIQYDDIELSYSDGYKNNQYIGTWSAYGSHIVKICNWGEYRIPFSGDLDIGAGEFGVDPKYYNQGWEEYKRD